VINKNSLFINIRFAPKAKRENKNIKLAKKISANKKAWEGHPEAVIFQRGIKNSGLYY